MLTRRSADDARCAVAKMIDASRHRGPDGDGFAAVVLPCDHGTLALGHARLSILDLTTNASQPMHDARTGSWLVFNGEIYNFRSLRQDLETAGVRVESTGDTEVLFRALLTWGDNAMSKLHGMYAFAWWDGTRKVLTLGRDPLGIKPLWFTRTRDAIVFASEIRALHASGVAQLKLSQSALRSFLTYGAVIEPEAIAQNVTAVPPGHVVTIGEDLQVAPPRRVWSLENILCTRRTPAAADEATARAEMEAALLSAVESHLVSDVAVGVSLSGGVDSSILALLANRVAAPGQIQYLTVGFPDHDYSEMQHADRLVDRFQGVRKTIHLTAEDLRDTLPYALAAMDQPTVDGINTFVISRLAANAGIKVLLSGLGGDELFGGYTTFRRVPFIARHGGWLGRVAPLLRMVDATRRAQWDKVSHARRLRIRRDVYLLHRSMSWGRGPGFGGALPPDNFQIPPESEDALANASAEDPFHEVAFLELSFYMRNQLLRDSDVFSSANGIELRVPFLDDNVVSRSWSSPAAWHKPRWGSGKRMTRAILNNLDPHLPQRRRKMGFTFPWPRWLRGPLFEIVADTIHGTAGYQRLGLERGPAVDMLAAFRAGDPSVSWLQVWSLFVLLDWQQRVNVAAA